MMNVPKPVRIVLAVVGLALVLFYANAAIGRYREDREQGSVSQETTATTTATPAPTKEPAEGSTGESTDGDSSDTADSSEKPDPTITVKVDGLNFREEPKKDGEVIRGLDAGEKLTLIKSEGGWYYAEDSTGDEGWLYGSDQYSTVEE